jgi:HD-like signal output (HDOD) protein
MTQTEISKEKSTITEATRPSVVVVDDELTTVNLLKDQFTKELVRFYHFTNIYEALVFIAQHRVDIVIASIGSPQIDGFEFMIRARRAFPDMTGILLSSTDDRREGLDAIGSGIAQYFLTKPCAEEEMRSLIQRVVRSQSELRNQRLKQTLQTFKNLPVPEKLQSRLRQLLSGANISLYEVLGEMEKNPALVAKVLRVSNSVHYSIRAPISTLREALIFIGTEYLFTLVSAIDLFENIVKGARKEVLAYYEAMWESSLKRAMMAKRIAEGWESNIDSSTAHVVGLLQDIGLLVRLCTEPDSYVKMNELAVREQTCLYSAELRVYATTHDELGAALLDRWNFPHEIIFSVANHHGETFGDSLTQIIQIADALVESGQKEPHDESLLPLIEEWRERLQSLLNIPEQSNSGSNSESTHD